MLIVLSPAKSLDFTPVPGLPSTEPRLTKDTVELAKVTRKLSRGDLKGLMDISDALAELNYDRFQRFDPKRPEDGVQAALAFAGDVYQGLDARTLDGEAMDWAQAHVRILSGLYGLLRPLDAIQPYRLEMGVSLQTRRGTTLYDFWADRISKQLNADAADLADKTLVNLASQEYFGAVDARALKISTVNVVFKEENDAGLRTLAFYAKKARGMMARWAIDNRSDRAEDLKAFDTAGYAFRPDLSGEREWIFARPQPEPKG